MAIFSMEAPTRASVVKNSAWRSRCTTWVATGSPVRPRRASTAVSIPGSRWAKVPTAPESLPTATVSRARSTLTRCRVISACQRASFRPKVIGSACTPWERPIITVSLCSKARRRRTTSSPSRSRSRRSAAAVSWRASAVSRTSLEVRPMWMKRASGPTCSATLVRNAMTSCFTSCSMASMRAASKRAFRRMVRSARFGIRPRRASSSHRAISTRSQALYLASGVQRSPISGRV
jgi:hypothetical protein